MDKLLLLKMTIFLYFASSYFYDSFFFFYSLPFSFSSSLENGRNVVDDGEHFHGGTEKSLLTKKIIYSKTPSKTLFGNISVLEIVLLLPFCFIRIPNRKTVSLS